MSPVAMSILRSSAKSRTIQTRLDEIDDGYLSGRIDEEIEIHEHLDVVIDEMMEDGWSTDDASSESGTDSDFTASEEVVSTMAADIISSRNEVTESGKAQRH